MGIRSNISESNKIISILSFGSYFYKKNPNDIDIIFITNCQNVELVEVYEYAESVCRDISLHYGLDVDLLFLTEREFRSNNLIDWGWLTPIYIKKGYLLSACSTILSYKKTKIFT